jgi:cysteine sulfinate desulfinase/cysteine desulfurase-like protein
MAMGLTREDADCTIRLSVGRQNKLQEMKDAAVVIANAARRVQEALGLDRR